ncbi:hypothetical protein EH071_11785 [Salmonella enterica]|nr:hypothetical protein [Salmonella enterica]
MSLTLFRITVPGTVVYHIYTQNLSRCIAAAREEISGSIDNYVTGVSERSQQTGSLKEEVYIAFPPGNRP